MGEFELLDAIRRRLPPPGPRVRLGSGDDAAIVVPEGATATSVDALVDGVHFKREWCSPAQIGAKALAAALSDLAAMGAAPGEAYAVLGLPPDLDEAGCLELLDGMAALAARTGTTLAGGDVSRSPVLSLAITVVGHAPGPGAFVSRAGARPGDALVVTGELGAAAAGLLQLEAGRDVPVEQGPHGHRSTGTSQIARQLEPQPRLEAGRALAANGATAMIDLSDGLGGDAVHIARASGAGLRIEAAALPLADGVAAVARTAEKDPLDLAVGGGEDYELLAALPAERFDAAARAVEEREGSRLTRIGAVVAGEGVEIRLPGGGSWESRGFDQLS